MAQVGGVLVYYSDTVALGKTPLFTGIDRGKFRRQVTPGDQLIMRLEVIRRRGQFSRGAQAVTLHVDPRAIVHPTAKLADGVTIGPFAIIGEEVTIGAETSIAAHAVLERWTVIGVRCRIG